MTEIIISIIVGVFQICLSINFICRRKNWLVILTEVITSTLLFCTMNKLDTVYLRHVVITVGEYLFFKIFLIVFMLIARIYCFYAIKNLWKNKKKKKLSRKKVRIIHKISKAKYWPKLKLGLPSKAGTRHPITNVKYDSRGFPEFKSYCTVRLPQRDYRKSREQHFETANRILYNKIISDSRTRKRFSFSQKELKELSQGETPKKYTWHHHQDRGVLEFVDYDIHSKTSHIGGYSIWGGEK